MHILTVQSREARSALFFSVHLLDVLSEDFLERVVKEGDWSVVSCFTRFEYNCNLSMAHVKKVHILLLKTS